MNPNKICFIYCVNDEELLQESLKYLANLDVPEDFEIDTMAVTEASSITAGYNYGMNNSDAKYKVYLHQDVLIINKSFIFDILKLFQMYPTLGFLGMVGAGNLPVNGVWWESNSKFGKVYESHTGTMEMLSFQEVESDYAQVTGIDGFMMITQYDLPWREDLFIGWHFYDLSQSVEFMKAGYEVGVPRQDKPWCIHDCGVVNVRNGYNENRLIFLEEYSEQLYPLVSVMIPTYNRPHYFELALRSVLEQTYKHIEIIVCDDSTNDETQQLIQYYLQKHRNIKYFKNEINLGQFQNDLKCMELALGEYVNFLMDDDLFHTSKIEKMMNYYLSDSGKEISLITSHRQLIDGQGNFLQDIRSTTKLFNEDTLIDGYEFGNYILSVPTNYIGEPTTVLFRKSDLEEPFGTFFGREYGCNVDLASWVNLLNRGKIVYIADSLSYFRIHGEQQMNSERMLVAGTLDIAHQILKANLLGFFSNEAQYAHAIGNCLQYMSNTEKMISAEYRGNSDFQQIAVYQQILTQKLQNLIIEPNPPLLSIAIPTYNRADILKKCLESIYLQIGNDRNFEVVVSNNDSSDHTEQVALEFARRYTTMKYSKNEENIGGDRNIFKVINESSGQFVLLHGDDDFFREGTLYDIIHIVNQNRHCGLVFLNLQSEPKSTKNFVGMENYLRETSIHSTFISSLILNKQNFSAIHNPDIFIESLLNQVYLQYSILEQNPNFCVRYGPVFYLPASNSGGYNYAEVFIKNYLEILMFFKDRGLSSQAISVDKRRILDLHLFPWFHLMYRNNLKQYEPEKIIDVFIDQYAKEPYFKEAYATLISLK